MQLGKVSELVSYLIQNRDALGALVLLVIGGVAVFLQALAGLVDGLVKIFPGLKGVDDKLHWSISWLNAVRQNKLLNWLAANPSASPAKVGPVLIAAPLPKGFARVGFLLFLGSIISLVIACAHLTPLEQQLLDCGGASVVTQINAPGPNGGPSILTQVEGLLAGTSPNWQSALDSLLQVSGAAVVCAVEVVVQDLTHASGRDVIEEAALARGQAWVASEGHASLVKPPTASKRK